MWILDVASATEAYHAGATVAFRASDRVRIGFTLAGVYRNEAARAEFFGGLQTEDGATGIFGTTVDASVWTLGLELTGGLQWDVGEHVTLGLSARTPSLDFFSSSTADSVTTSATAGGMAMPSVELRPESGELRETGASSLSPPRVRAGVAFRLASGWLALDADVQPAWTDEDFGIEREAVWNARIGGIFGVTRDLSIGAGLFTDRAADPEPADFLDSRIQFYGASLGLQIDNMHELAEGEDADTIVFSSTVALRYAFGVGETAGLLIDFATEDVIVTRIVDMTVHELGLHVGSALRF